MKNKILQSIKKEHCIEGNAKATTDKLLGISEFAGEWSPMKWMLAEEILQYTNATRIRHFIKG